VSDAKPVTTRGSSKPSKDLAALIEVANEQRRMPDREELFSATGQVLRFNARALSDTARAFLGEPDDVHRFRDRYDALVSAQKILPSLADRNDDFESSGFSVPVKLYRDQGVIAASGTFLAALEGTEADRIRRCEICERIFWAPRINSACCTQKCRKNFNKRESRAAQKKLAKKKQSHERGKVSDGVIQTSRQKDMVVRVPFRGAKGP
jgi:hypothetical protein